MLFFETSAFLKHLPIQEDLPMKSAIFTDTGMVLNLPIPLLGTNESPAFLMCTLAKCRALDLASALFFSG